MKSRISVHILLLTLLLVFSGCASKDIPVPEESVQIVTVDVSDKPDLILEIHYAPEKLVLPELHEDTPESIIEPESASQTNAGTDDEFSSEIEPESTSSDDTDSFPLPDESDRENFEIAEVVPDEPFLSENEVISDDHEHIEIVPVEPGIDDLSTDEIEIEGTEYPESTLILEIETEHDEIAEADPAVIEDEQTEYSEISEVDEFFETAPSAEEIVLSDAESEETAAESNEMDQLSEIPFVDEILEDIPFDYPVESNYDEIIETDSEEDADSDDSLHESEDDRISGNQTENEDDLEEDSFWNDFEDEPELIFFDDFDSEEAELPEADAHISAVCGEPLIISFENSGWVYLGDLLESGVIQLEKRQNGLYSTVFTFSAEIPCTGLLEFWSYDPLTNEDVYVHYEITLDYSTGTDELPLTSESSDGTQVLKNEETYQVDQEDINSSFPESQSGAETEQITESSLSAATEENLSSVSVGASETEKVFSSLDSIDFNTFSADEVTVFFSDPENFRYYGEEALLYYEGKVRESHNSARDIRRSVACYEMLVKKYPASKWWEYCRERSKYLRKYYYL